MALPTSYSGTDIAQLTGQAIRAFAAASQGSDVVFNAVLGMRTTVYLVEYDYAAGDGINALRNPAAARTDVDYREPGAWAQGAGKRLTYNPGNREHRR